MPKLFKFLKSERGVIHLIPLFLILIGIVAGVYLVQHPQIFKPKATENAVKFSPASGKDTAGENCKIYDEGKKTNCPKVNLQFNTPNENQTYAGSNLANISFVKTAYASHGPNTEDWYCDGTKIKHSIKYEDSYWDSFWDIFLEYHPEVKNCSHEAGSNGDGMVCKELKSPPGNSADDVVCVDSNFQQPTIPQPGGDLAQDKKPVNGYPENNYEFKSEAALTLDQRTIKWFCSGNKIWRQYYGEGYDPNLANTWKIKETQDNEDCNVGNRICQQYRNDKNQDDAVCVEPGVKSSCDGNTLVIEALGKTTRVNCTTITNGDKCQKVSDTVAECLTKTGIPAVVNAPAPQVPATGGDAPAGAPAGGGTAVTGGARGGAPIPPGCGDNPVAPPNSQTQWKTSCSVACNRNEDCEVNRDQSAAYFGDINTTRWCYGFEGGKIGSSRCMQLRYTGGSGGKPGTNPTTVPITAPAPTPTAAPAASYQPHTTKFFRFAENPTDLQGARWIDYTDPKNREVKDYTFKDSKPGLKTILAEFKYSDETVTNMYQYYIEFVQPAAAAEAPKICTGITAQNATINTTASATVQFNSTANPSELKIWIASNNDINKGAVDVGSWTGVKTVSNPKTGSRIDFGIPSDFAVGSHAVLMTLDGANGMIDGNVGGKVNPSCTTMINLSAATSPGSDSQERRVDPGAACVPNVTECGCGNKALGREKENAAQCTKECGGGWCKGNPNSSLGGICATCSAQ